MYALGEVRRQRGPIPVVLIGAGWSGGRVRAADLGRLVNLAASQAGVVSARQAHAVGVSRRQLRDAVDAGILQRIHPSVFRLGGGEPPPSALINAAILAVGPGAYPSHESAFHLHGIDHVPFVPVVTTGPGGRANLAGVRVHRVRDLRSEHLCAVGRLTTTTVERALVDVSMTFSAVRTEWLLDHLTITVRRTSIGRVGRVLRQVDRRGRVGLDRFARLLDDRGPAEPASRSRLEKTADGLLARTTLPTPSREYPLPVAPADLGYVTGFVDRAWPEVRLILEIDGRRWHARERDMARDRRRDRGAAAAGWQTLRVLDEEVRDIPDDVVRDVEHAYAARAAMFRVS